MFDFINQLGLFVLGGGAIFLIARKNKWGFVIGLFSQIFWFATSIINHQWGIFFLNFFYTGGFSYGIYQWFFKKDLNKPRPSVGLAVIIQKEDKVLLGKRKNAHGTGRWGFPGGHIEHGETWEECAIREVAEETGIEIENIEFKTATNDIFEKEGKHYNTIFMSAKHKAGDVKVMEPNKCEKWQWFSWNDLPTPLFLPIENLKKNDYNPFKN